MKTYFKKVLVSTLIALSLFLTLSSITVGEQEVKEPIIVETKGAVETEKAVETVIEHKPAYPYTEEELDILSRLIYSEGGTESYDTQLKIGSVVLNRLNDPNFPNTIEEVIYETNQFSVTFTKINGVVMIERPASEEAKKVAWELLNYGSILPEKVQVFYRKGCTDEWVNSREVYETADNTVFAYIYSKGDNQNGSSVSNL